MASVDTLLVINELMFLTETSEVSYNKCLCLEGYCHGDESNCFGFGVETTALFLILVLRVLTWSWSWHREYCLGLALGVEGTDLIFILVLRVLTW